MWKKVAKSIEEVGERGCSKARESGQRPQSQEFPRRFRNGMCACAWRMCHFTAVSLERT